MSEVIQRDRSEAEYIATTLGLVCFFPEPTEIFLDIDGYLEGGLNAKVAECMENNGIAILGRLETKSKSGNAHIYLRLSQGLEAWEKITLQACLGSDPTKESLSLYRIRVGGGNGSIALFETPDQAKRVEEWRKLK